MKNLLLVTVVCCGDYDLALKRSEWMRKLGQKPTHHLLLVNDGTNTEDAFKKLVDSSRGLFLEVFPRKISPPKNSAWPHGVNHVWRSVVRMLTGRTPVLDISKYTGWIFFEPDMTPLNPNWIEILDQQYTFNKRPFMGAKSVVYGTKGDGTKVTIECMNGGGLYPFESTHYSPSIMLTEGIPWDVAGLGVGYQHKIAYIPSNVYILTYGVTDCKFYPESKSEVGATKTVQDGTVTQTHFNIDKAILHHGCKDGSLIDILSAGYGVQGDPATGVYSISPHETSSRHSSRYKRIAKPKEQSVGRGVLSEKEIIKDYKEGLSWHKLVGKYKISPVDLKKILEPYRG